MEISTELRERILVAQRNEATESEIYKRIAARLPQGENRQVLERIAADEARHARLWKHYTGADAAPDMRKVRWYTLLSRLFGFTFGAKLMETGEQGAQINYADIARTIPEAQQIHDDEEDHEARLLAMLDEESLHYAGSVVLGLNDALVELTGALAGLTFAFQDVKIIALSGLITGIAASFSMAASEYLSTSSEKDSGKSPLRASVYTGIAYVITVALLILPYLLLANKYISLGIMLVTAVAIIALFNFYYAVAQGESFKKRFIQMAAVSLGVAALSFGIGYLIRIWLGVDI